MVKLKMLNKKGGKTKKRKKTTTIKSVVSSVNILDLFLWHPIQVLALSFLSDSLGVSQLGVF
jgi:hypothetical protein